MPLKTTDPRWNKFGKMQSESLGMPGLGDALSYVLDVMGKEGAQKSLNTPRPWMEDVQRGVSAGNPYVGAMVPTTPRGAANLVPTPGQGNLASVWVSKTPGVMSTLPKEAFKKGALNVSATPVSEAAKVWEREFKPLVQQFTGAKGAERTASLVEQEGFPRSATYLDTDVLSPEIQPFADEMLSKQMMQVRDEMGAPFQRATDVTAMTDPQILEWAKNNRLNKSTVGSVRGGTRPYSFSDRDSPSKVVLSASNLEKDIPMRQGSRFSPKQLMEKLYSEWFGNQRHEFEHVRQVPDPEFAPTMNSLPYENVPPWSPHYYEELEHTTPVGRAELAKFSQKHPEYSEMLVNPIEEEARRATEASKVRNAEMLRKSAEEIGGNRPVKPRLGEDLYRTVNEWYEAGKKKLFRR